MQKIDNFIKQWSFLPEQGTKEWLAMRGIGGSEMKLLLTNMAELVLRKITSTEMQSMLPMVWGTVLEPVIRKITEMIFKIDIYESGSIPSCQVKGKTYSMDGLGLTKLRFQKWNSTNKYFWTYVISLFEFKCPFSRVIKQSEIYPDYIPQVKSGLSDIDISQIGIYIEGVFRICNFEDLGYNRQIINWLQPSNGQKPISWGFIGFYVDNVDFISDYPEETYNIYNWLQNGQIDFAKTSKSNLLNLFHWVKKKQIKTYISSMGFASEELKRVEFFENQPLKVNTVMIDAEKELSIFYQFTRKSSSMPLGVLSIKLVDLNIVLVEKEQNYTKKYEKEITEACSIIEKLNAIEDINDRMEEYNKIFNIKSEKTDVPPDLMNYLM